MLKTVEGVIKEDGTVALLEGVEAVEGQRVLVTVLKEASSEVPLPPWTIDWNDPEAVRERIAQSRESIRAGEGYTLEEAEAKVEQWYREKTGKSTPEPAKTHV